MDLVVSNVDQLSTAALELCTPKLYDSTMWRSFNSMCCSQFIKDESLLDGSVPALRLYRQSRQGLVRYIGRLSLNRQGSMLD
jgi:hypothetical protein